MTEMKTILATAKSSVISYTHMPNIKASSFPQVIQEVPSGPEVKHQISAPSYLLSLGTNEAPPFKKPLKEAKATILVGTIMCADEVVEMIAAADADTKNGLKTFLGKFLVNKNVIQSYELPEKKFLIELIREILDYAAQRDFSAHKLAVMITIYMTTHMYFKWYYWMPPTAIWSFFKELMIRHTIEDSPDGVEVFQPDECYDIVSHFHTVYMNNLPLIHIHTFSSHRLKLNWSFKPHKL